MGRMSKLQLEILYYLRQLSLKKEYTCYSDLLKTVAFSNPTRYCTGIDVYGVRFKRPYSSFRVSFNRAVHSLIDKGLIIDVPRWVVFEEDVREDEPDRIAYMMLTRLGNEILERRDGQNELTLSE